jgi:hypothetical protein
LEVSVDREQEARALLDSADLNSLPRETDPTPFSPDPDLTLATIFEGNNPLELASIKAALQRAGIPFYVQGEELAIRLVPIGPLIHPWCRVQVASDKLKEALAAIPPFEVYDPDPSD